MQPGRGGPRGASKDQPITLKVGDNWGATHPMAKVLDEVFKPEVEQGSDGAIQVEVYHSGTLGNEADLWDGVRNGTIEVAVVGTPMNQEFPTMLISDWPFLYRDLEHAKKVWTGDIAAEVNQKFEEKFPTVQVLGWGPNSARTFTSSKKLTTIEDFAGQKFRMPNNPIHIGLAENLGGSAQVIPLGELFSALETGVVDGQDNGMVTVISEGLNEVQDYIYETNHIIATLEIVASDAAMDRLSEAQQKVVRDAAAKASTQAWDQYIASVDTDRQSLKDKGLTVTELTPADRDRMIEKIKPVTDKLYADNAWARELTDKIRAVS
ncbi:TRAP transporter substrate-binding protein [Propioniciclava coleopterorum]|uniref:TRAP transporter substrate-binding protein n=1 Tax=Propioniciclava coleopterorum TaxID=2714937 RepID=UPI00197ED497|nr:TRAP transporter substrate-binding protein [Propioniciclava coleopterorum]